MPRISEITLPATLLLAALFLSACASQSEPDAEPVAAPSPVKIEDEQPTASKLEPAPTAVAEQPNVSTQEAPPKPVKKAKKRITKKVAPPSAPEPAPAVVAPPAPVAEYHEPPVVQPEPAPPVAPPVLDEPGFLEQYWMWLLGLLVIIVAVVLWRFKSRD
jgi:hypothetical protein